MTRDVISLQLEDLSSFAKRLRKDIETDLGHAEFLDRISKAAGYRNYQHLRVKNQPAPVIDKPLVERALRQFDEQGLLAQWPAKTRIQHLCCWVIWSKLPPRLTMTEREISTRIDDCAAFRDAAQIRRTLIEQGGLMRNLDGSQYKRCENPLPAEAVELIKQLRAKVQA